MAILRASLRLTARADGFRGALRGAAGDSRRLGGALQGAAGRGADATRRTTRAVGLLRSALGRTRETGIRAMRGLERATRGWRSSLQQLRGSLGNLRTDLGGVLQMLAVGAGAVGGFAREASFRTDLVRLGTESGRTPGEMEAYDRTLTRAGVRHGLSRRDLLDMAIAAQAKGGVRLEGDLLDAAAQLHIVTGAQSGRETGEALAVLSRMPGDLSANLGGLISALAAGQFSIGQVQPELPRVVAATEFTGDIRQAGALLNIAGLSRPSAAEGSTAVEQLTADFRSLSTEIRKRFGVRVLDQTGDLRQDFVQAVLELVEKQPTMVELGEVFTREVVRTLGPLLSQERDADGLTAADRVRLDLARPLDQELLAENARTIQQGSPEFAIQSTTTRLDGIVSSLMPLRAVGEAFRQFQTEILAGAGLVGTAAVGTRIVRAFRSARGVAGGADGRGGGLGLPGLGRRAQSMHVQTMTVGQLVTGRGPGGSSPTTILGPDGRPTGGRGTDRTVLGPDGRPAPDRPGGQGRAPSRTRRLLRGAGRRLPLLGTLAGGALVASDLAAGDTDSAVVTGGGVAGGAAGAKVGAMLGAPAGPVGAVAGSVAGGLIGWTAGVAGAGRLLEPSRPRRSVRGGQRAAELAQDGRQPSRGLVEPAGIRPRRSVRGGQRAAELAREGRLPSRPRPSVRGDQAWPGQAGPVIHEGSTTINITVDGGVNRDDDLALSRKVADEVDKTLRRRDDRMRQRRRAVPVDRTSVRLH